MTKMHPLLSSLQTPTAAFIPSVPRPLPAAADAQVWLDFDGTLTNYDLLDELIARYSKNDSWRLIEERWRQGIMGSRQCLAEEFALLSIDQATLQNELTRVQLDPGTAPLLSLLNMHQVPTAILSDGIDHFIKAILTRAGVPMPIIRANTVLHKDKSLTLQCPHASTSCTSDSAHCKCSSTKDLSHAGKVMIYVGDGRSDLCAARKADIVFAKGVLARELTKEERPFYPFTNLLDVHRLLATAWT